MFEKMKYYQEGKKLNKKQKNIELTHLDDLLKEAYYIGCEYKNLDSLDDRAKEVIKEIFSYGRESDSKIYELSKVFTWFNSNNVKEQLIDLYFEVNDYPQEFLQDFINENIISYSPTNDVALEDFSNEIKRKINAITDKITRPFRKEKTNETKAYSWANIQKYKRNPFELKISHDKKFEYTKKYIQENEFFKNLILKKCYDEIDVEELLDSARNFEADKFFEMLPEHKKSNFAKIYINSTCFEREDISEKNRLLEIFKEHVDREFLVNLFMKNGRGKIEFFKDFQPTNKEIFDWFKKTKGFLTFETEETAEMLEKALKETSFEDIKTFLENIDILEEYDFFTLLYCLNSETKKELLKNDRINSKIKEKILEDSILDLSNDQKSEMFEKLTQDEQKKLIYSFVAGKSKEKQYLEQLQNIIKDENLKKIYGILYREQDCSAQTFIDLINGEEYNFRFSKEFLLKFSDDELKEIYEKCEREDVKQVILGLNRKKKELTVSDEEKKEIEEYNKTIPNSILINEDTILHYLKTAKSLGCYRVLFNHNVDKLQFSQLLDCYKIFLENKETLQKDFGFEFVKEDFKNMLVKSASQAELLQLFNEKIIGKERLLNSVGFYKNLDITKLEEVTNFIESIQNVEVTQSLLTELNKLLLRNTQNFFDFRQAEEIKKEEASNINNINSSYIEKINDKNLSINHKYLYLGMLLSNYKELMRESKDKSYHKKLMDEFKVLFEKVNNDFDMKEYNSIFNFEPKYGKSQDYEFLTANYDNIAECLPYLGNPKVYELLQKLHKNNSNIQYVISKRFLNEKLIDFVDYELIEYLSRYGVSLYSEEDLSEEKFELFIKAYDRLKTIKTYPEETSINLMSMIKTLDDTEINLIDFEDENNLDLLISIALREDGLNDFSKVKPTENSNRFEVYKENLKESARKEAHSAFVNKRKILNAIGKRFFNYSYLEMRKLKKKYDADFKEIYESYLEKSRNGNLSLEEENELKSLTIFRNISELLEIKDTAALVRVFDELDKDEANKDCEFAAMSVLEENMKRVYSKDLQKNTYTLNEKDKIDKVDGIDVYSPKEFKMFVHVVSAFGKYELIDKENTEISAKERWNLTDNAVNHILCTSYIGNDNMCYARKNEEKSNQEEKVIFGFSDISNTEIIMASQTDIGSQTTDMNSNQSYFLSRFRLADKIIKKCRHGHNEVDLERRQKNNKSSNIQPEYIVCFDEINESSKKAAKDFNIPIVLINKREVAKHQNEKLNKAIQTFKKTKQPEILEEIIDLYQCARNSFAFGDKDKALGKEFFSPESMNVAIQDIISTIDKELKLGNKEKANDCYLALYDALIKEIELCKEENIEPEEFSNLKFTLRKFAYEVKQIIGKNNIKKISMSANLVDEKNQDSIYKVISNERKNVKHGR